MRGAEKEDLLAGALDEALYSNYRRCMIEKLSFDSWL